MSPFVIHTGNILHLPDLKRKPGHTPADEVSLSVYFDLSFKIASYKQILFLVV